MSIPKETLNRFWAKVEKTSDCWNWSGATQPKGYGTFRFNGAARLAHRVSFEIANGAIRTGAEIDHICHTRGCVRPSHLREVTHKQNMENYAGVYASNSSGVRGVHWHKQHQKWNASVQHGGKRIHVGLFRDLQEAERAVMEKRLELFTHNEVDRREKLPDPLKLSEVFDQVAREGSFFMTTFSEEPR